MQFQIPLPFTTHHDYNFSNFIADDNQLIIQALKNQHEAFVFLWGDTGTGKTHLLQAACQQQTIMGGTASYLPLKDLQQLSPKLLDGMEFVDLVCIDDIDIIKQNPAWEEALFNLFNNLRQQNGRLIISSQNAPQRLPLALNDLKSRLNNGLALNIQPLNDEATIQALQTHAQSLGLDLNDEVAHYILSHYPRDLPSLWRLIDKLDKISLATHKKLTIPFVKSTFA